MMNDFVLLTGNMDICELTMNSIVSMYVYDIYIYIYIYIRVYIVYI